MLKDDMHILYPHLRTADSIVLAAPTYFQGMPSLPKTVVDRCQPFWALKYVLGQPIAKPGSPERLGAFLSCAATKTSHAFDGSRLIMASLWHVLEVTPAGESLYMGVDHKGQITEHPGARVAAEDHRPAPSSGAPHGKEEHVNGEISGVKTCINCGKPLADRVEEEERTGTGVSRSTGECSTYRVWFCVNSECVMFKTDLYREQIADRSDR